MLAAWQSLANIHKKGRNVKKILLVVALISVGYLINARAVELAYALGFAELKMQAVLVNEQQLKVKCNSYALGYFDEIALENKFQQCINRYLAEGYKLVEEQKG
jgi:hypothetical protein